MFFTLNFIINGNLGRRHSEVFVIRGVHIILGRYLLQKFKETFHFNISWKKSFLENTLRE